MKKSRRRYKAKQTLFASLKQVIIAWGELYKKLKPLPERKHNE